MFFSTALEAHYVWWIIHLPAPPISVSGPEALFFPKRWRYMKVQSTYLSILWLKLHIFLVFYNQWPRYVTHRNLDFAVWSFYSTSAKVKSIQIWSLIRSLKLCPRLFDWLWRFQYPSNLNLSMYSRHPLDLLRSFSKRSYKNRVLFSLQDANVNFDVRWK